MSQMGVPGLPGSTHMLPHRTVPGPVTTVILTGKIILIKSFVCRHPGAQLCAPRKRKHDDGQGQERHKMDAARAIETFCDVTKGTDVTRCAQIAKSIEEDFAPET